MSPAQGSEGNSGGSRRGAEMEGGMHEAEALFSRSFGAFLLRWSSVDNLHRVMGAGLPAAEVVLAAQDAEFAKRIVGPEFAEVFMPCVTDHEKRQLILGRHKRALAEAQGCVDAACLVFAHSILDATALDYCRVTALDRLHAICRPPSGWASVKHFKYKRARMKSLDDLRHRIVHGTAMTSPIGDVESKLSYLRKTGIDLMALVNHEYGLSIDPGQMLGIQKQAVAPDGNEDERQP
jgi:hypothetical protein